MSTKKSLYNRIDIQSSVDASKVVDLRLGVSAIAYYENIFSPAVSMNIQVTDSGSSVPTEDGKIKTLYEGLPLRGKERVFIDIKPNSDSNLGLRFIDNPLIVRSISGAKLESKRQSYTLNLISAAGIENEFRFCTKTYNNTLISEIARQVMTNDLGIAPTNTNIDSTINSISINGGQQKPFKFLMKLARRGVSGALNATGASAGCFVYQTTEGMQFRGIDSLTSQESKQRYFYQEKNVNSATFVPTPDFPSLDYKIIQYSVLKNQDVLSALKNGGYATTRRFFDPITFSVMDDKDGLYNSSLYGAKDPINPLGRESIDKNTRALTALENEINGRSPYDRPSRILSETFSYGTYDRDVTTDLDENIYANKAQSLMRYNQLFSQAISMLVPLNTNLHAGDIITILIPESSSSQDGDIDYDQKSGRYLIKELCHYFDASGSYTKLKIVRDSFGWVSG